MDDHTPRNENTPSLPDDEWEEWMEWDPMADCPTDPMTHSLKSAEEYHVRHDRLHALAPSSTPSDTQYQATKKRKVSPESVNSSECTGPSHGKATSVQNRSHSIVEKRYRTNLNDKIADLRKRIPSLREDPQSPLATDGMMLAFRPNKATVLTKAIEYISHLERRNAYLEDANATLRIRAQALAKRGTNNRVQPKQENVQSLKETPQSPASIGQDCLATSNSPQGMISVPEAMKRLRDVPPQPHYAEEASSDDQAEDTSSASFSIKGGRLIGKLMVGSLAGLMVMDGLAGGGKEKREDRGLFALPLSPFLLDVAPSLAVHGRSPSLPYAYLLLPLIKSFLIFSVLGLTLFLYLFNSKPTLRKMQTVVRTNASLSSVSPIEVRQNAFLTSIQTVWVPRHSMLPEMIALVLETLAYLTRQILGWRSYSWLTGRNEDLEIARVRAWEIAQDAQLAGGDAELSKSRLVLTLWAAGTLPKTPTRLMLKALHIRVMFWQASRSQWLGSALNAAATKLARQQWNLARKMVELPVESNGPQLGDPLPQHLMALLQQPVDGIMTDIVIQRAHNLAWNRPSDGEGTLEIENVAEDTAMRGPLDALALWSSSLALQQGLYAFVETNGTSPVYQLQMDFALRTAPPGSSSFVQAMAAKVVFSDTDHGSYSAELLRLLPSSKATTIPTSLNDSISFTSTVCLNVLIAIRCAKALDMLNGSQSKPVAAYEALQILDQIYMEAKHMDLLAFAAAQKLMLALYNDCEFVRQHLCSLNQIVLNAIIQMDKLRPQMHRDGAPLCEKYKAALQKVLVFDHARRRSSNASVDPGNESMDDREVEVVI
ncbi:hypothetical protein MMC28_000874 [Mycoblastus sanguinarius]|nr:hypothetical protein [Mycoblastus sanguinarius]